MCGLTSHLRTNMKSRTTLVPTCLAVHTIGSRCAGANHGCTPRSSFTLTAHSQIVSDGAGIYIVEIFHLISFYRGKKRM